MSKRANDLADRLEQGARALAAFANELTDAEWQRSVPKDGRSIGVIVHQTRERERERERERAFDRLKRYRTITASL